jgi:hypothetical protein
VRLSGPAMQLLLELMAQALGVGEPAAGTAVTVSIDLGLRCELTSKPGNTLTLRSANGDFTADDLTILIEAANDSAILIEAADDSANLIEAANDSAILSEAADDLAMMVEADKPRAHQRG